MFKHKKVETRKKSTGSLYRNTWVLLHYYSPIVEIAVFPLEAGVIDGQFIQYADATTPFFQSVGTAEHRVLAQGDDMTTWYDFVYWTSVPDAIAAAKAIVRVPNAQQVEIAKNLVWSDLESGHSVDSTTSGSKWNFVPRHGIVTSLAQTAGPWYIRGNANIHRAFSHIWETKDLITSMDAVLLWPGSQTPTTEGLHLDQNPFTKPDLDCIQGMVPLLPVTPEIGGLEIVPYSHTLDAKENQCSDNPHWKYDGNFCKLFNDSPYVDSRLLVECSPGDLILWGSRCIHGGLVGTGIFDSPGLVRMSIT